MHNPFDATHGYGLDSLDGPAMGGPMFGADPPAAQQQPQQPWQTGLGIGSTILNDLLTTFATIAALELQRTGQVSAQTQSWQAQLAAFQGQPGGGAGLTPEQIAALQVLQGQAQQQQAALTPWYKEPAVMVPFAIVVGLGVALATAMAFRGRANRVPSWDAPPWGSDGRADGLWAY